MSIVLYASSQPEKDPSEIVVPLSAPTFPLTSNEESQCEIALSELYVHWKFNNSMIPEDERFPSLVLSSLNPNRVTLFSLTMFPKKVAFLKGFQNQFNILYTLKSQILSAITMDYIAEFDGVCFKLLENAHNKKSYLWIHDNLARYLFSIPDGDEDENRAMRENSFYGVRTVDNEKYYVFAVKHWERRAVINVPYLALDIKGPLKDVVPMKTGLAAALVSPDIQTWEKLTSPVQSALHVYVSPNGFLSKEGYFYHYSTPSLKFVPVTITAARRLRFRLLDTKTLDPFPLASSHPIWIKLIYRERITSPRNGMEWDGFENTRLMQVHTQDGPSSTLQVVFTSPLELSPYYDWDLALTTLTFPDSYDIGLSLSERTFMIYRGNRFGSDFEEYEITLPTSMELTDLVTMFQNQTNAMVRASLSGAGRVKIFQKKEDPQINFVIHTKAAEILGIPLRHLKRNGFQFNGSLYDMSIPQGQDWTCPEIPSLKGNRPHAVKVMCPDVKPSLVNGKLESILKMMPVYPENSNKATHVRKEWTTLEYHKIIPTRLKSITLQLIDSYNQPIKFDPSRLDQTVHASLQLRMKKKNRESFSSS